MKVSLETRVAPSSGFDVFSVWRFFITGCACILVTAADLWTKAWAFELLGGPGEKPIWWVWEGVFGFQTTLNEGAVFGLGQGWTNAFTAFGVAATIFLIGWFVWVAPRNDFWVSLAVGIILGGIFGNLYDRLGLHGLRWQEAWIAGRPHAVGEPVYAVRDFILVMIGPYHWPNFNLADSSLVCGVAGLILRLWMIEGRAATHRPSS
ncbi:MAG: signal peptidase II [Thermoguttaceae bacterium]|nr:signal peptidase II [Thermoguttaceae bacterium]MDW8078740.1 signal peptidase II [Thermoguttaceae bacterium]